MRSKITVFISSINIARCVDKNKICRYCGPGHNEEIINQELKRFRGAGLLLSTKQREILHMASEFCQENDFELEVVDMSDLSSLDKVKLAIRGIRAPAILCEGHKVNGTPTKDKLKALSLGKAIV